MLAAMFAFSINDVMGKWLVGSYGVAQLLLIRSIAAGAMLSPGFIRTGWKTLLFPPNPWLHALRAFCSTAEVALFYWAVVYLPLADTVAFYLASPIFATILAIMFLKEQVGWRRWLAVLIGFVGVLIAVNPTGQSMGWPALIAISGSFLFAGANVLTRRVAGTNEFTLIFWQFGSALIFGLLVAPWRWVPPSLFDFACLSLLGIVASFAHMGCNRALRYAPAAVVIPYQYSLIVWAVILGYIFFGDWPAPNVLIGSVIIVAAGMYIFIREQIRAKERSHSAPHG